MRNLLVIAALGVSLAATTAHAQTTVYKCQDVPTGVTTTGYEGSIYCDNGIAYDLWAGRSWGHLRTAVDRVDIEAYDGKGYDAWFIDVLKQPHDGIISLPFLRQGGSPYGAVLCEIDIVVDQGDQVSCTN
jgi:hypothetical protein